MLAYPDSAIVSFRHIVISLTSFMGDTNHNDIKQDLPPNRIIGSLEIYKEMKHASLYSNFFTST